ncbi:MAG: histidine--tRNA ligase [Anaerolineae bacterium]|nr:histidine--tRNA ligase [Anaerolineae bacterium]
MAALDPRTPKGMRDFLPDDLLKRQYVFDTIIDVFETFGFEPLDTPALEMRETLHSGDMGEDAVKQIFYAQHPEGKEELALRYDLTVPLARVVAQYENQLTLPFRRYHIAPVWRSERPQRGRYREFYQCDADIVGIESMIADAEILSLVVTALRRLGFREFETQINNRKIITGIGEYVGVPPARRASLYRSIDKLDKIGLAGVRKELAASGIAPDAIDRMMALLQIPTGGVDTLGHLREELDGIAIAREGITELIELASHLEAFDVPANHYTFNPAMVRGLGYYTGPVFETFITEPNLGSVTGGGRYDNLVGMFRKQSLPTTGTSLGVERIIDLMDELSLYPPTLAPTVVQVLVTVFGADTRAAAQGFTARLRAAGIHTELYLEARKIGKQLAYADRKGIPLVVLLGSEEIKAGTVSIKRLRDGEERTVPQAEAAATIRDLLAG